MREAPRVLVVGGDGWIGRALVGHLRGLGWWVRATTRRREAASAARPFLDLERIEDCLEALPRIDVAVLAAAVARLRDCAADPTASSRVNIDGTVALSRAFRARGTRVLLLSSDKVFDGTVARRGHGEAVSPITEYGRQKALGEAGLRGLGTSGAILRLSKVIDRSELLMRDWLDALARGRAIQPFDDMNLAPVPLSLVCRLIARMIEADAAGIHHASGLLDLSYADFARRLARALGAPDDLIRPVAADPERHPPEVRPPHSSLDMGMEFERYGIRQPDVDAVVAGLVAEPEVSAARGAFG